MSKSLSQVRTRSPKSAATIARVAALSFALVLAMAVPIDAHETGVIKLSAKALPVGGGLTITGEKMTKGASFRLELRGALKTFSFGRVRADTSGRFELRVTLPPDAHAGAYTVAAVAADGDVSAQADLTIAGAGTAAGNSDMAGMPGMGNMPGMAHATAEHMDVPLTTTKAGWAVIAVLITLSAVGGLLLLRRRDEVVPRLATPEAGRPQETSA